MILYHDDCINILKTIPSQSVDMILVDEPYETTRNRWDFLIDQDEAWRQKLRIIKPHGAIVHFATDPYSSLLISTHLKGYKHKWIWSKKQSGNFAVAKHQPLSVFEELLVFTSRGEKVNYYPKMITGKMRMRGSKNSTLHGRGFGGMKQVYYASDQYHPTNILEFPAVPRQHSHHPSQKPVDLLSYLIETYSQAGGAVLDYCMGSGSTGEACKLTGREFIGIEMDECYFEIAKHRISEAVSHLPPLPIESLQFENVELLTMA